MTSLDLAAIRARAQAATPGPWVRQEWPPTQIDVADGVLIYDDNNLKDADAAFIAHARQDIPALCDRVEELERREAEARAALVPFAKWLDECEADQDPYTPTDGLMVCEDDRYDAALTIGHLRRARAWLAGSPQPKGAP